MQSSSHLKALEKKDKEESVKEDTKNDHDEDDEPGLSLSDDSEDSDFDREYTCDLCNTLFSGLKPLRQHERSGKHLKALRRQKLQKEIDEDLKNMDSDDDFEEGKYTFKNKVVAECEVCDKQFNGPESYILHLKSKNHKRKIEEVRILEEAKKDGKIDMEKLQELLQAGKSSSTVEASSELCESDDEDLEVFKCKECKKVFSGLTPYRDHLISKSHKKTLKQKNLKERLINDSDEGNAIELDDDFLVCKICRLSFSGVENVKAHLKGKKHADVLEFLEWKEEKKRMKKERESDSKNNDPEESAEEESNSKDEISAVKKDEEAEKKLKQENTWKAYESYKNYKSVMNDTKNNL